MFARLLFILSSVLVVVLGIFNPGHAESSSQASKPLPVVSAHEAPIYALAFSPDGMMLASAGADQSVAIWNTRTWQLLRRLEGFGTVRALAFDTDGSILAAGTDEGTVQLWKTATWAKLKTISAHKKDVRVVAFGRGGILATAGRDDKPRSKTRLRRVRGMLSLDRTDDVIKVWNASEGSLLRALPKATSRVQLLRFSSSGKFLASGAEDSEITVTSTGTWRTSKRLKFQPGTLKTLAFDTSGNRLISSGYRQSLTRKHIRITNVWTTSDWALVTASEDQPSPIRVVDYDLQENQLATGNRDGTVTLLSLNLDSAETLGKARKLEFSRPIDVIRFSPDGRTLVFGNADGSIEILKYLLPVPRPALSVVSSTATPVPEPKLSITPLVPIPMPVITAYFSEPSGVSGIIFGAGILIFSVWLTSIFFRMLGRRVKTKEQKTTKIEAERQEALRVEAARTETQRQEALKVRAQIEAERYEALKVEAARIEAQKREARRVEAARIETQRQEAVRNGRRNELSRDRGYVYLLKAGPYYKIGKSIDTDRRLKEIKLQLPYPVEHVHDVMTDNMSMLESKWHRHFKDKRANGEWFLLSDADVAEFTNQLQPSEFR